MLEYHSDKEFFVDKSQRGSGMVMCHRSKGQTLVFFFKPDCQHCASAYPHLKKLASEMHGRVQFVLINLNTFPGIIDMSAQTVHALEFVPIVFFYNGGRPYSLYDGDIVYDNIRTFVTTMIDQIRASNTRGGERADGMDMGRRNQNAVSAPVESEHHDGGGSNQEGQGMDPKEYSQGTPYNLVKCDRYRCYLTMSGTGTQ